jgi:hypothetical protein
MAFTLGYESWYDHLAAIHGFHAQDRVKAMSEQDVPFRVCQMKGHPP